MKLSMFLESEQDKAKEELDCYGYCLQKAITLQMQGDFKRAQMWHENLIRSLNQLEIYKQNKTKMEYIAREMELNHISVKGVKQVYEDVR